MVLLALTSCSTGAKLTGTPLGGTDAPDFTLTDAQGRSFSLHDYRGKAVVLTFLYTHCPDICPALAGNLASVAHRLGKTSSKVAFVAVSVDPEHDDPKSVVAFTHDHDLTWLGDGWRYGLGTRATLTQIWASYGIGAAPQPAALTAAGFVEVDHNAVLYLIDPRGRERTVLDYGAGVDEITRDVRAIAGS